MSSIIRKVAFELLLKDGRRCWPTYIYNKNSMYIDTPLDNKEEIENILKKDDCIYIQSNCLDSEGFKLPDINGLIKVEDIDVIRGPYEYHHEPVDLSRILTMSYAAQLWGLGDGSTIRKRIKKGAFRDGEVILSGHIWLTTYDAMRRVFGHEPKESK